MNHQHYKELCYLWSLSSPYWCLPKLPTPTYHSHLKLWSFVLYLEILLLNLRNFLKVDTSSIPLDRVHCLGMLLNSDSINLVPPEVRIKSLVQHELVSFLKKNYFILHNTYHISQNAEMIYFSDLVILLLFSTHKFFFFKKFLLEYNRFTMLC